MVARYAIFIAIITAGVGLLPATALAQSLCPASTPISNGSVADASVVTAWFSCNPSTNASFAGNVGIGNASPGAKLTIADGTGEVIDMGRWNSNTNYAGIAFHSSSAVVGSSDISIFGGAGDLFLNRGTGGEIHFRLNNADQMIVTSAGNVGIGTASPSQKLEVNGQAQIDSLASASSTSLCISATTNGVLATCSSSIRYKENVRSAAFGLSEVMAMRPVTFKWKGRNENDFGLIAEEVAKINPLFATYKNGKIEGVKYPQLVAVLAGAIKAQQAQLEQLRAENARANEINGKLLAEQARQRAQEMSDISALTRQLGDLRKQVRVQTARR